MASKRAKCLCRDEMADKRDVNLFTASAARNKWAYRISTLLEVHRPPSQPNVALLSRKDAASPTEGGRN